MGPRFFKRGEMPPLASPRRPPTCFNGATLLQAWRVHGLVNFSHCLLSFNGATLLQAWRVERAQNDGSCARPASMGPRFFKRGELTNASMTAMPSAGFNGATLLQAWRVPFASRYLRMRFTLQWGHASSSVESDVYSGIRPCQIPRFNGATLLQAWRECQAGTRATCAAASMGPRFFKRGEWMLNWEFPAKRQSFNGATLLQAWRDDYQFAGNREQRVLQWGHASSSVERNRPAPTSQRGQRLQWGHASSSVESLARMHC